MLLDSSKSSPSMYFDRVIHIDSHCRFSEFQNVKLWWYFGILTKIHRLNKKLYGPECTKTIQKCQLTSQLSPEFFMKVWEHLGAEKSHLKWNYGQNGREHQNTPPLVSETPDILSRFFLWNFPNNPKNVSPTLIYIFRPGNTIFRFEKNFVNLVSV